jgi:hypothetical protein
MHFVSKQIQCGVWGFLNRTNCVVWISANNQATHNGEHLIFYSRMHCIWILDPETAMGGPRNTPRQQIFFNRLRTSRALSFSTAMSGRQTGIKTFHFAST